MIEKSRTTEKIKEELMNWKMLRDSKDDLISEVEERIKSINKEINHTTNSKKKETLKTIKKSFLNVKKQITENAIIASGQIEKLEKELAIK